jgi:Mg2+ and Co2+ transporter CorA
MSSNIFNFPGKIRHPDMQEEEAPAKLDRRSRDRVHDRANMQSFLFRSYDLIVESDEADLFRDVCLDIHKAEVKLKKVRQRLQRIQEQSAAQIRLLTAADTKLTAAIVAALLSGQR